jgi:hypothetical protein
MGWVGKGFVCVRRMSNLDTLSGILGSFDLLLLICGIAVTSFVPTWTTMRSFAFSRYSRWVDESL